MDMIGFARHDHADCVAGAIRAARAHCTARGLQFTAQRQRVLEILLAQHRALGAYDILDILRREGMGAQPPVVYRALDFLVSHGFAHRIERLNAFVACAHIGQQHVPAFLICRNCTAVAETDADPSRGRLSRTAREAGFQIEQVMVEAEGLCPACRAGACP